MDLYALLGVNRAASTAEVERAYRRLARRYHPGINPGDTVAAQYYQQLQEAYVVLSDADRRREYDRVGEPTRDGDPPVAFEGFDFSTTAEGPRAATFAELFSDVFRQAAHQATSSGQGGDAFVTVRLSFEQAVRGGNLPLTVPRRERCAVCAGDGHRRRVVSACPHCGGDGTRRWTRGHMVFSRTCDGCGGDGRTLREPCPGCRGEGTVLAAEVVTVPIPPGVEHGARLSVPGYGHDGRQGAGRGDLYVAIDVARHRHFTREGADLHLTLPVGVHEAALGAIVTIPGLEGPVRVRIPAGTGSGTRLVVRGQGGVKPGGTERGDIVATAQIVLPATLDSRSRDLLREFGERNGLDVRRTLFDGS